MLNQQNYEITNLFHQKYSDDPLNNCHLPDPTFLPRPSKVTMAVLAAFFPPITPEVETSTSSYTGTLLWHVAQIF